MLEVMTTWTADMRQHVAYLGATIPNPDDGEAPPFADQVTTLLK